jgi:hypothetical protein
VISTCDASFIPGATPYIDAIFLQPRQADGADCGFHDQFALQVIGWLFAGPNNLGSATT